MYRNKVEKFMKDLRLIIRWRMDVASGEMIEQRINGSVYCRSYLVLAARSSAEELLHLCDTANFAFAKCNSNLRVNLQERRILPKFGR